MYNPNTIIVCASGYFNPLHEGHINYLNEARGLGDELYVIVNNDHQVWLKGSTPFMSLRQRQLIVDNLKCVTRAYGCVDTDRTVCKTLELLKPNIFANGGDVIEENCGEAEICRKLGIKMVFGVGGTEKIQSSSSLLERIKSSNS